MVSLFSFIATIIGFLLVSVLIAEIYLLIRNNREMEQKLKEIDPGRESRLQRLSRIKKEMKESRLQRLSRIKKEMKNGR